MAKRSKTKLTFAVTIEQPSGTNIPGMRTFIKHALITQQLKLVSDSPYKAINMDDVKIHLLNKETQYG
jgi:hypothetical protein